MTIVLVGDAGFNPTDAKVDAKRRCARARSSRLLRHACRHRRARSTAISPSSISRPSSPTATTSRRKGKGKGAFHFRSHPAALKALIDAGFNLFSLANNHAYDYGAQGVEETLYHVAVANAERAIAYAGIGSNFDEAIKPGCIDLDGTRIGFSAIGIMTGDQPQYRAGPNKPGPGLLPRSARFRGDRGQARRHAGRLPHPLDPLRPRRPRRCPTSGSSPTGATFAAEQKGIDLILGHHPHVAQGVELDGKSLIFYGLGNFLHPGTAEMTRFGICRDYGLMAKVHLARIDGAWRVEAIEAIPLTNTQDASPSRSPPQEATKRIYALNHLAAGLDDEQGRKGVRFTPQADGSGLYCADGAAGLGGKLGTLCQGWQQAAEPDKKLATKIAAACEDKPFYGKPSLVKRRVPQRVRPRRPVSGFVRQF